MIKPINDAPMSEVKKVNVLSNAQLLLLQHTDLLKVITDRITVLQEEGKQLEAELKKRQDEFTKLNNDANLARQSIHTIEYILNNDNAAAEVAEANLEANLEPLSEVEEKEVTEETDQALEVAKGSSKKQKK